MTDDVNDFSDKLIDFVNKNKVSSLVAINACVRLAAFLVIEGGGDAESFARDAHNVASIFSSRVKA